MTLPDPTRLPGLAGIYARGVTDGASTVARRLIVTPPGVDDETHQRYVHARIRVCLDALMEHCPPRRRRSLGGWITDRADAAVCRSAGSED